MKTPMMNWLLAIVLCFSVVTVFSQSVEMEWVKAFETEKVLFDSWSNNRGHSIRVFEDGRVVSIGTFSHKVDFDPGVDSLTFIAWYTGACYVSILNADGSFDFAGELYGSSSQCREVRLDSEQNIIIAGDFSSEIDFDPGPEEHIVHPLFAPNLYVLKLNSEGEFSWVRNFRTVGGQLYTLATDNSGNSLVAGSIHSTVDFDPGSGNHILTSAGNLDGYIMKLNSVGEIEWLKQLTGSGSVYFTAMTVDVNNNILVTGAVRDTMDFDPGDQLSEIVSPEVNNTFIAKYSSNGDLIWAREVNTNPNSFDHGAQGIGTDQWGNVFAVGSYFGEVDFDPGPEVFTLNTEEAKTYVLKLNTDGEFVWVRGIGGNVDDNAIEYTDPLVVDAEGNTYVTGHLTSTNVDFDPGPGEFLLSTNGSKDFFVVKLSAAGDLVWAYSHGGPAIDGIGGIGLGSLDELYVTGHFRNTATFMPGDVQLSAASVLPDIFVLKYQQSPVSAEAISMDESPVSVYPNPIRDFVNVTSTEFLNRLEIRVFDVRGVPLKYAVVSGQKQLQLDLSELPVGVYLLELTTNEHVDRVRVVKQ